MNCLKSYCFPVTIQPATYASAGIGGLFFDQDGESHSLASLSFGIQGFVGLVGGVIDGNLLLEQGDPDPGFFLDDSVDRCREQASGRFANDERCKTTEISGSLSLEALISTKVSGSTRLFIGPGINLGTRTAPYLVGGIILSDRISIRGGVGSNIYMTRLAVLLPLGG